jgi:L-2,4-diaminobutyrate decarboxylase
MKLSHDIEKYFSPAEAGRLATELGHCLERYYRDCQSQKGRTVPALTPDKYIQMARDTMTSGQKDDFVALASMALANGHHLHDPRYMGHQVPPSVPAAALFDVLGRTANQGAAVFEMAPFGTSAERAVINELGKMIGWEPGKFAGIGTHGGTLANVTALLAARNIRYGNSWKSGMGVTAKASGTDGLKPAILTSADSHYCIARACGILGIGTSQLIKVPIDEKRRMNIEKAREILKSSRERGLDVFAIVGSACTTPTGSFDDLGGIADLAREYNLWFHVDGAHGASFLFSEKHKHLLAGIDQADSIAWDAHKMLFVPALSTYLFYRDARHSWQAFAQDAPYLFDPDDPTGMAEFDGGLRTFECTKGALSLGLWGIWSLYGKDFIASLIDRAMDNTRAMRDLIDAAPDFEAAHDPQCNILCFRYLPQPGAEPAASGMPEAESISNLNQSIRNRLVAEGEWYITGTRLDGHYWLRVTIINPLTDTKHLAGLLDAIRKLATVKSGNIFEPG